MVLYLAAVVLQEEVVSTEIAMANGLKDSLEL